MSEVNVSEVMKFLAADRKYVKIRWTYTGKEEIRFVKVINPGRFDLLQNEEKTWDHSTVYPEDAGEKVSVIEVIGDKIPA